MTIGVEEKESCHRLTHKEPREVAEMVLARDELGRDPQSSSDRSKGSDKVSSTWRRTEERTRVRLTGTGEMEYAVTVSASSRTDRGEEGEPQEVPSHPIRPPPLGESETTRRPPSHTAETNTNESEQKKADLTPRPNWVNRRIAKVSDREKGGSRVHPSARNGGSVR